MKLFGASERKRPGGFGREAALSARPVRLPVVRTEEAGDGKLQVTVLLERTRWQQRLGASAQAPRTFGLDKFGREVYAACDGKNDVTAIVRGFARAHRLGLPEAEIAVTTFLKTLVAKGVVAMAVDKDRI